MTDATANARQILIRLAGRTDAALFDNVDADVFDGPVDAGLLRDYLADPRLHIVVAMDGAVMVGMCSGVHYHHPDKAPQIWVNELGVAGPWRRRGIATRLIGALAEHGRGLGCSAIWVVAEPDDIAEGFYESLGWARTGERLAMFSLPLGD